MPTADSQAAGIHAWWMCSDEASRRQAVDALSAAAWQAGERVAVVRSPEAILNHVSVLENILLPAAWHRPEVRT